MKKDSPLTFLHFRPSILERAANKDRLLHLQQDLALARPEESNSEGVRSPDSASRVLKSLYREPAIAVRIPRFERVCQVRRREPTPTKMAARMALGPSSSGTK